MKPALNFESIIVRICSGLRKACDKMVRALILESEVAVTMV